MVYKSVRKQKKIPVEVLQEQFLQGPADETVEQIRKALKVDQIVTVKEAPKMETIVFRNQRDPGVPLDFHYASKKVPFKMYSLIDGETYTLPVEVIQNLEGCRKNIYKMRKSSQGVDEMYLSGYRSHFVCERAA